jgi:hypothetical protein
LALSTGRSIARLWARIERGCSTREEIQRMGLLDILNGMQNGSRGQQQPKMSGSSGSMSPIMKAVLGLLAYKALKGGSG